MGYALDNKAWRFGHDKSKIHSKTVISVEDGATESQIYRYVLFPQLTPTLLTVLIILGHISMKAFDLIIGINGKSYVTQVVAVYMWESTFD